MDINWVKAYEDRKAKMGAGRVFLEVLASEIMQEIPAPSSYFSEGGDEKRLETLQSHENEIRRLAADIFFRPIYKDNIELARDTYINMAVRRLIEMPAFEIYAEKKCKKRPKQTEEYWNACSRIAKDFYEQYVKDLMQALEENMPRIQDSHNHGQSFP